MPLPNALLLSIALLAVLLPGSSVAAETDAATLSLAPLPELDLSVTGSDAGRQLGEQRTAVERLLAESAVDPARLATALSDLGLLYVVYDFLEPAAICLENARRLEPESFRRTYLLGYARMLLGLPHDAIALYRQTLVLEPAFLPAAIRLGRTLLQGGRLDEARATFEGALELDPRAAAAHEGLGKVASAGEDFETAVLHFERALELDPEATGIHYALAQAHRQLRHLDQVRWHLERAGDVPARVVDPLLNPLASLAQSAQFYLVQGGEALENRDYPSAAAAFSAAIERDAHSFPAYRGLGISLERLGDRDGARRAFEQALERGSTGDAEQDRRERAGILRSLGLLEADSGRHDEAARHYQASLALAPDQPDLLLRTANALARDRRFAEAVATYDRLIEMAPEWAPAILEKRATALVNLGRRDEAVADFSRAVEAAPDDARLRRRFADALEVLGETAAAASERAAAERLAADGAQRVALLVDEGRRLTEAGDPAAAVDHYRQALELEPRHLEARFGLAALLGHSGNFDQAAKEFEQILAAAPRHLPARRGEIVALVLGGRYGQARERLQEALRTFPRHLGFALTQVRLLTTAPDAAVRDGALALAIARRIHAERRDPAVEETLAAAYAAAGQFEAAAALERDLVAEAERRGDPALTAARHSRLAAYEARRPVPAATPREILVDLDLGNGGPA